MVDIEVESTCDEGYTTESVINGEWEIVVDALNEDGPSPNEVLVADYASCYIPALRVAADKYGHGDIGTIDVEAGADLDEDDDLETIEFHVEVEESLGDEQQDIVELATDLCHVHSALIERLHAEITIESGV